MLSAEDESIFCACSFTSPDFLPRALLKAAAAGQLPAAFEGAGGVHHHAGSRRPSGGGGPAPMDCEAQPPPQRSTTGGWGF